MDIGHVLVGIADAMETAAVTDAATRTVSPPIPDKFSLTERVLVHMMRENTGASILDSGGAYGRAWQRNLSVDFAKRERGSLKAYVHKGDKGPWLDLCADIDLFHYLVARLDYDRALTRQYRKFVAGRTDTGHIEDMEAFPEWIAEKRGVDADNVWTGNSYNEDNFLSGTVQYTCFQLDGEDYVLLQIHGGCDVRGGYTAPQVFRTPDCDGRFGDWYQATIYPCWKEVHGTRDALLADFDRQAFLFPEVAADYKYEVENYGDDVRWDIGSWDEKGEGCAKDLTDYPYLEIETRDQWRKGTVCVLPDHSALCPETGATLRVDFLG